eukprot:2724839-Rhodomonas_salina.1
MAGCSDPSHTERTRMAATRPFIVDRPDATSNSKTVRLYLKTETLISGSSQDCLRWSLGRGRRRLGGEGRRGEDLSCLLYTSDAADDM